MKLYGPLTGIYVATILVGNVVSQKMFAWGSLYFPGGVVVIPLACIFGDIFVEVYGYERTRPVIWTAFLCQTLAALAYLLVGALPPAPFWPHQAAYQHILGVVPRIALASMIAFLFSEFVNSWILSRMKFREGESRRAHPAKRFFISTAVGTLVDSFIFMALAFAGAFAFRELMISAACLYAFKIAYEAITLPFSTVLCAWVKRCEGLDHTDDPLRTDYRPF